MIRANGKEYALEDIPALVQKNKDLGKELEQYKDWNEQLQSKLKSRAVEKKGKKGQASWEVKLDEKQNRVLLFLSGRFTYPVARTTTMHIMAVLSNSRRGFDIIVDISDLFPSLDRRSIFHVKKMLYNMRYMGLRRAVLIRNRKAPQIAEAFEEEVKTVYGEAAAIPTVDDMEEAEIFINR